MGEPVQADTLLRSLADDEAGANNVVFRFDVRTGSYEVLYRQEPQVVPAEAPITLAIYNELKLSQYVVEDAEHSTPNERQFSLTERGRHLAKRRSN
ncbi:MAG: hypothetical protein WBW04_11855 [Nitrolancea sp.]